MQSTGGNKRAQRGTSMTLLSARKSNSYYTHPSKPSTTELKLGLFHKECLIYTSSVISRA